MKNLIKIAVSAIIVIALRATEERIYPNVTIVDHNQNESIQSFITDPSVITVFGATPKFSALENYIEMLRSDYKNLINKHEGRSSVKNINKEVSKAFLSIEEYPGLKAFDSYVKKETHLLNKIFFDVGFDFKTLRENFEILIDKTMEKSSPNRQICLIHILLPSYFAGLEHIKDGEILYGFLKKSADFYKQIYLKIPVKIRLKVFILIPKIKHFIDMVLKKYESDEFLGNIKALNCEIFEKLNNNHKYIFLNQDGDQLIKLKDFYARNKNIGGDILPITNSMGCQTTRFNSYLIDPKKSYKYQESIIFNSQLADFAKKFVPSISLPLDQTLSGFFQPEIAKIILEYLSKDEKAIIASKLICQRRRS